MTNRSDLRIRAVRVCTTVLLIMVFTNKGAPDSQPQWEKIRPLHSTRVDVERLLGTPTGACNCVYSTPNETIAIDYASGPCEGPPNGWNVTHDTVLRIRVSPKQPTAIAESELIQNEYVKSRALDEPIVYYTNVSKGVKYSANNGFINTISYLPSVADLNLRCAGFPQYDGGIREYHPYASFSSKAPLLNERFDQFAFQLRASPHLTGYIISYAGRVSHLGEAATMAESAKRRVTRQQDVSTDRIVVIDGGFRDAAEYELFLIPNDMPPPAPTPTLASTQVRIVGRR